jgi:hypothetical protein
MLLIFTVRDSAVEAYSKPVFAPTRAAGIRSMEHQVNSGDFLNPECFDLFEIGSYDEQTGIITAYDCPVFVIKCLDLVRDKSAYPIGGV